MWDKRRWILFFVVYGITYFVMYLVGFFAVRMLFN